MIASTAAPSRAPLQPPTHHLHAETVTCQGRKVEKWKCATRGRGKTRRKAAVTSAETTVAAATGWAVGSERCVCAPQRLLSPAGALMEVLHFAAESLNAVKPHTKRQYKHPRKGSERLARVLPVLQGKAAHERRPPPRGRFAPANHIPSFRGEFYCGGGGIDHSATINIKWLRGPARLRTRVQTPMAYQVSTVCVHARNATMYYCVFLSWGVHLPPNKHVL